MDNPFKKILAGVENLGHAKSENAIGIDVGSSSIKVVEIKKKAGKAMLETYGSIALGPYAELDIGRVTNLEPEKITEAVKELLKQSGTTTPEAGVSIPMQSSLVFTVTLPSNIKEGDMETVVATEARKYIPVPMTEVSVDYFILPQKAPTYEEENNPEEPFHGADKSEVLVVATQNEAVSRLRQVVKDSEVSAGFFEVEIFSSLRANLEHELSLVLLIDFGAARTKISVIEFGMVRGYHTVNRGGADITDSISKSLSVPFPKAEEMKREYGLSGNPAEPALADIIKTHTDYLFSEINGVLLAHEKKYNRSVAKIICTGGGALLKGLKEAAASYFKAEIEIGRPFTKVGTPAFLERVLEATGPEFAIAIGLALRKLE